MRISYAQSAIFVILFSFTIKIVHSDTDFSPTTDCSITEKTYTLNSTFHSNLKVVLSNLTYSASSLNLSFSNFSFGQNNDKVYGLYLCRGDLTTHDCSSCILNITESITADCPNKTESISWDSKCMIRYANRNIFSKEEESPDTLGVIAPAESSVSNGTLITPPPVLPTFNRTKVVYDLINETAFSDYSSPPGKTRFFATREDNMTGNPIPDVLYSLAQCTPDITPQMCHKCLTKASHALSACPDCLQGHFYFPSCQFQIDVDRFFSVKNDTKVPGPPPSSNSVPATSLLPPSAAVYRKMKGPSYIPIAIGVSSAMVVLLFCGFCCFFMWKWKVKSSSNDVTEIITMESLQYDISTIKTATDNFSADNKLGQGGFCDVYKGRLQSGKDIAVKRLRENSKQGIQDFKTEVLLIAKLQHKNLIRLLGFCATEEEKILIYEYFPYPSLDRLLFGGDASLVWETRYKIIDGIAKGLLYLHEDSRYRIIHRDLKPSNILLDKNMTPKISDFGLAKLFGEDQIQFISRRIVGTYGYMAPEYERSGQLSVKSDVYSFGRRFGDSEW